MKKFILLMPLWLALNLALGQKNQQPKTLLTSDKWTFAPGKVEFIQEKEMPVMKILPGAGKVTAKAPDFSSGTIEFDVKPNNTLSFFFRMKDEKESESFYFRMTRAGNASAGDALQYTPYIDGVNMWDMYGHYQTNASYSKEQWNHVKLVISGSRMRMYVNSADKPTLEVDKLEGNTTTGKIAFEGDMQVANLMVKPDALEGLSPDAENDPTNYDPRYIRQWAVSEPVVTPKNVDFSYDFFPDPETKWRIANTERRGLVNLTRLFGKSDPRRITWLKVDIKSEKAQNKKVDLGFGDDVWVFLNGQFAYVDKNLQGRPIEKTPEGRCSVENTSFTLPLKQGSNELLIGLANDFFGWGAIARMEDLDGIEIKPDPTFDRRLVKMSTETLDSYVGVYMRTDGLKITIIKEGNQLSLAGENFVKAMIYPTSESKFFMRTFAVQMEFTKNSDGKISGLEFYNNNAKFLEAKRIE